MLHSVKGGRYFSFTSSSFFSFLSVPLSFFFCFSLLFFLFSQKRLFKKNGSARKLETPIFDFSPPSTTCRTWLGIITPPPPWNWFQGHLSYFNPPTIDQVWDVLQTSLNSLHQHLINSDYGQSQIDCTRVIPPPHTRNAMMHLDKMRCYTFWGVWVVSNFFNTSLTH